MTHTDGSDGFHLPEPTPWPMVLALGVTLLGAGLVTSLVVSGVGLVLAVIALVMMIREDLALEDGERGS